MQMANPPMQICMEPSDWLKGIVRGDGGMDSSTPSGELISCAAKPQVMERRLRPQHDHALKCPRCDSTHTKFCYYNNYSLSQPRYFCKTCRRYWTKGGSLRNVPVGGGCRKNKRSGAKNKLLSATSSEPAQRAPVSFQDATDLHLSFSGMQLPLLTSLAAETATRNLNFMDCKYNSVLDSPAEGLHHLVDSKYGAAMIGLGDVDGHGFTSSTGAAAFLQHGGADALGFSLDGSHAALMEAACQRLALPYEENEEPGAVVDVKSADRILSLQWQDQCCADAAGRESLGYVSGGLGSWTGVINGHGHSAAI